VGAERAAVLEVEGLTAKFLLVDVDKCELGARPLHI
jgi:hypothetical protein